MNDKDPSYWVEVPPTASPPTGSAEHARLHSSSDAILLVLLTLLLLDTFLPWQRACLNVSGFGFHISGCLSANAWTASGARFGQIAGVLAILAIIVQGLRLG